MNIEHELWFIVKQAHEGATASKLAEEVWKLHARVEKYRPVIQDWVCKLPYMQQTVLLTCVRGPDGMHKEHPAKNILRWFRRCVLVSAFDGVVLTHPDQRGGGSFTGPQTMPLEKTVKLYRQACDELPHHFQMHVMHAAEILGYKHPTPATREWWHKLYQTIVNDLHLFPEHVLDMDTRLGDNPDGWRGASALADGMDFAYNGGYPV